MSMPKQKKLAELTEVINIEAIQQLPKATEHFISDLHGEFAAFDHILRNGSGSIREKVHTLFQDSLSEKEETELCFAIYYPEIVLSEKDHSAAEWSTLMAQLVAVARFCASKYTRSKVRKALPKEFAYILEELLYQYDQEYNKAPYYAAIFEKIIALDLALFFCQSLANLIQRLVVDHLHVLGDIYDRGPAPDKIIERLMTVHSLDIQLGNHDILWIGSFCGSLPCLANMVRISARYGHLVLLTESYGIDLTKAIAFSRNHYQANSAFAPKNADISSASTLYKDAMLLQQAFAIIQFKLEAAVIFRRPEFQLQKRNLLDKLSANRKTINYFGTAQEIKNGCFQLVDPVQPYRLTSEEQEVLDDLHRQLRQSKKLAAHLDYLVAKGTLYQPYNDNLLFHGCLPCHLDGLFQSFQFGDSSFAGKELMDFFEDCINVSFAEPEKTDDLATDVIWYLWCGEGSSLFGKKEMKTFERYFLADPKTHKEDKNAYYTLREQEAFCKKILSAFNLPPEGRIINGHTPVKLKKGETPVKANSRLLVIDGGLSKPYQKTTGIAGYTLLYNSFGMKLVAHQPFTDKKTAIKKRQDIHTKQQLVFRPDTRITVKQTDIGKKLAEEARELLKRS